MSQRKRALGCSSGRWRRQRVKRLKNFRSEAKLFLKFSWQLAGPTHPSIWCWAWRVLAGTWAPWASSNPGRTLRNPGATRRKWSSRGPPVQPQPAGGQAGGRAIHLYQSLFLQRKTPGSDFWDEQKCDWPATVSAHQEVVALATATDQRSDAWCDDEDGSVASSFGTDCTNKLAHAEQARGCWPDPGAEKQTLGSDTRVKSKQRRVWSCSSITISQFPRR